MVVGLAARQAGARAASWPPRVLILIHHVCLDGINIRLSAAPGDICLQLTLMVKLASTRKSICQAAATRDLVE